MVRGFRPDLLFALQGRGMLDPPCPQAAFPQMSHLFYPSRHHGNEPLDQKVAIMLRRHDLRRHLRHTQLILCQTEVVERRIRAVFGYEGDAYVCGSAVPEFMHGSGDEPFPAALEPVKTQYRLFSLSKYYAHKNLEVLVELFRRYPEQLNGIALIVTVAADQHPNAGRFLESIARHGLADRIVNVGPIAAREVPGYYRHTQALIKPTLIETLGLPFLEAMHFGLPILTSDLDFAHAVCGDAAEYFDPWDPASILQAILRLKGDETLRSRLIENGANRLKTSFSSWDEIARKTAERFERMAGGARLGVESQQ
jgi:glycosyltransferase involved in cell wall biosynthesis